ncbi:MAG: aspartate kinase [Acidobacteria bacterium]|nr:aspartate kinase [Acidobacteriota bacterium]
MAEKVAVHKFGGTSLGSAERFVNAARLVQKAAAEGPVAVVASAMSGVTDRLIAAAVQAERGHQAASARVVAELRQRHVETAAEITRLAGGAVTFDGSILAELETALSGVALLRERTPRVADLISSFGERLSAPLLAATLSAMGCPARALDARAFMVTDDNHGSAKCDRKKSDPKIRRSLLGVLGKGTVPVVTGFIGRSPKGETTTLGRSGSDTTAALLGAAIGASAVVIWTDVDGVLTADPRIVPEARLLPQLSYREAAEMTYFGAKVLHFPAVLPAIAESIPLIIKNSFRPEVAGTTISSESLPGKGIRAISSMSGLCLISLDGRGMMGVPGIAARVFSAIARSGVSVMMFSQASSEQNIALVVPARDRDATVEALTQEFRLERMTGMIDGVLARPNIGVIAAVGEGMRGTPGIAARVFEAVAAAGVNVEVIAQGSSECNISFGIDEKDAPAAVRALHAVVTAA